MDGLRAVSVLAVIAFHGGLTWFSGGFFGVEVFFAISGYLITSLLIGEQRASGTISLAQFWTRRARRLLPALFVMITAVVIWAALFASDAVAGLRRDVPAALVYVSNFVQIFTKQDYFATFGREPLLKHLWSLAVEEQFYVLWPLVFLYVGTKVSRRLFLTVTVAVALGSSAWMALASTPDMASNPQLANSLYLSTFTRLSGLLLGCALAMVWRPDRLHAKPAHHSAGRFMDALGVVGLVVLALMFVIPSQTDLIVYRGGFLIVDVATLMVVMAVVHPNAKVGKVLGAAPLRWVGLRSYGLYLWHFPIFAVTRPGEDLALPGPLVALIRIVLTVAITEACFRWVEQPVRHGALSKLRQRPVFRASAGRLSRGTRWAALSMAPLAVLGILVFDRSESVEVQVKREIIEASAEADSAPLLTVAPETSSPSPTTSAGVDPSVTSPPDTAAPETAAPTTFAPPVEPPPTVPVDPLLAMTPVRVSAIGDSVMLGAKSVLTKNIQGIVVTAEVSRQFGEAVNIIAGMTAFNTLGPVLLVHLGTNGTITQRMLDKIMELAGPLRQVYFVTTKVERPWELSNNALLIGMPARYPNARVIDWFTAAVNDPSLFVSDHTHLTSKGIIAYTQLILNSLN